MTAVVHPRRSHLAAYHVRQREKADAELAPLLDEAARMRAAGATWEEVAAHCRSLGFVGRSGRPVTTSALYQIARRRRPGL
ncbi:hypothetical protein DEIGR_500005 [Deinococcus grandis]|uniref:Uncharacterized protein n=1 Tax=Deinococcus grandis TaxID=57498 RepID=A0A124BSD5_9DEIO|nr:hypothetical protein DEGR_39730 [Deinococcus grandis]GAQ24012.1 hypothetical protein DEIGR_500005 [Deinococcus grandis]